MRNTIRMRTLGATLFLMLLCLSCSTWAQVLAPRLELRTLRISETVPGFEYQYFECVKKFLGICTKQELRKEIYDLRDDAMRKKLIAMGFVARVRDKP